MEYVTSLNETQLGELGALIEETLGVPLDFWPTFVERLGRDRLRAMYDGDHLAAGCGYYDFGHWFGGQRLAAIGVTIVGVPAEDRGRGCAYQMLGKLLAETRDAGYRLASLFASTQHVYRRLGFEQAGSYHLHEAEVRRLSPEKPELEIRRLSLDEAREVFPALYERYARSQEGMLDRSHGLWERLFDERRKVRCFAFGPTGAAEGYAVLLQKDITTPDPRAMHKPYRITVLDRAVTTPRAWQSLFALIASHRSVCDTVRWWGPANDPLRLRLAEQDVRALHEERWMLRILDVEKAFGERGYPAPLDVQLSFAVEDELLPQNSGAYELTVEGGTGRVRRVERAEIQVHSVEALAPFFSGLVGARQLASFGVLEGSADALARAELAFCGSEPWLSDHF